MKALPVTIFLLSETFVYLNQLVEKFNLKGYGLPLILVKPRLSRIVLGFEVR